MSIVPYSARNALIGGGVAGALASLPSILGLLAKVKKGASKITGQKISSKTKSGTNGKSKAKQKKLSVVSLVTGSGSTSTFNPPAGRITLSTKMIASASAINDWTFNMPIRIDSSGGVQTQYSVLYADQYPFQTLFNRMQVNDISGNNARRLLARNMYGEITFTNCTNSVLYVQLYDVMSKRELTSTSSVQAPVINPHTAWQSGLALIGNSNPGASMVGTYPTKVPNFRDYWKVCKVTKHMLSPGEVHKHKVYYKINKIIPQTRVDKANRYAGLTYATMLNCFGTPIDGTGQTTSSQDYYDAAGNMQANTVVNGNITTSPVHINLIYHCRYQYQWVGDTDQDTSYTNTITKAGDAGYEVMPNTGVAAAFDDT